MKLIACLGLFLATMMIIESTTAKPIPETNYDSLLPESPLAGDFNCPINSLCRKHCRENGFKDGVCQGLFNKDCRCIG
ncbi:uncharacterized protein LOC124491645 [Dermatophagoides farinae]|uniref:Uncharacterized protein n=2 Tax=Dermatophagoides farinae TaxID=6954 RepID=A0A922I4N7_DERFA|nr:hypothetical protein DERF_007988 [Dermatophagoides farinae]